MASRLTDLDTRELNAAFHFAIIFKLSNPRSPYPFRPQFLLLRTGKLISSSCFLIIVLGATLQGMAGSQERSPGLESEDLACVLPLPLTKGKTHF